MGTPKTLTRDQVLEYLKSGKTAKQIAEETGHRQNAIRAHVARLIQDGRWESDKVKVVEKVSEFDYDTFIQRFIDKVNHAMENESKIKSLEDENWKLRNQNAAYKNEIEVLKDEVRKRSLVSEKMKDIQKRLNNEQAKLTQEAIN